MRRILRAFVMALALAACGDSDPCSDPYPCDIREGRCQQRAAALVSCLRESAKPLSDVPMTVVPASEYIEQRVQAASRSPKPSESQLAFRRSLAALGLASPPADSATDVRGYYENIGAFYDTRSKAITILDRGEPLDSQDAFTILVHELTHAEQDRDGAFDAGPTVSTLDESLARRAMTEGEATLIEMRARIRLQGHDERDALWEQWLQRYREAQDRAASMSGDLYRDARALFPYAWGASYVWDRYQREGQDGVRKLYGDGRPRSTLEVMSAAGATRLALGHGPMQLGVVAPSAPWMLDSVSHLGAWFVRQYGRRTGIAEFGLRTSGDVFNVLTTRKDNGEIEAVPLWRIELTSELDFPQLGLSGLTSSAVRVTGWGAAVWITIPAAVVPEDVRWAKQEKPDLFFEPMTASATGDDVSWPCRHGLSALPPPILR